MHSGQSEPLGTADAATAALCTRWTQKAALQLPGSLYGLCERLSWTEPGEVPTLTLV